MFDKLFDLYLIIILPLTILLVGAIFLEWSTKKKLKSIHNSEAKSLGEFINNNKIVDIKCFELYNRTCYTTFGCIRVTIEDEYNNQITKKFKLYKYTINRIAECKYNIKIEESSNDPNKYLTKVYIDIPYEPYLLDMKAAQYKQEKMNAEGYSVSYKSE